jgi:hypothetical protein
MLHPTFWVLSIVGRRSLIEFCYSVYNQYESFICLDLIVKNIEIPIKRYFK